MRPGLARVHAFGGATSRVLPAPIARAAVHSGMGKKRPESGNLSPTRSGCMTPPAMCLSGWQTVTMTVLPMRPSMARQLTNRVVASVSFAAERGAFLQRRFARPTVGGIFRPGVAMIPVSGSCAKCGNRTTDFPLPFPVYPLRQHRLLVIAILPSVSHI